MKKNILFTLLTWLLFLLPDLILGNFLKISSAGFFLKDSVFLFWAVFLISFCKRSKFLIYFWFFLQSIDIAHCIYFGVPIHPYSLINIFSERDEIILAIEDIPLLIVSSYFLTIIFSLLGHRILNKFKRYHIKYCEILFFISSISFIVYKGPQHSLIRENFMTSCSSLKTFFNLIIWGVDKNTQINHYKINYQEPQKKKILLILGESMNPHHSFNKENTPFLYNLKPFWRQGYSYTVHTIGSITFFLNMNPFSRNYETNLFYLAKKQGYYTTLYSAQNKKIFKYSHTKYLDEFLSHTDLNPNDDEGLLEKYKKMQWKDRHFCILHLRHAHSPYQRYCPSKEKITGNKEEKMKKMYNYVMRYHDNFLKRLFDYIPQDVQVIFVSDHGEMLGPKYYGHSFEHKGVHEIPVWSYPSTPLPYTHLEIAQEVASWMGVTVTQKK